VLIAGLDGVFVGAVSTEDEAGRKIVDTSSSLELEAAVLVVVVIGLAFEGAEVEGSEVEGSTVEGSEIKGSEVEGSKLEGVGVLVVVGADREERLVTV
jgi:hypothetical protein